MHHLPEILSEKAYMHLHKNFVWLLFISAVFALLLEGCATSLGDNIVVPVGELAMYEATPKEKSLEHMERNMLQARKGNVPFLAPHYFREASDIFNLAKSAPDKVPTAQLAKADVLLDQGEKISATIKQTFARQLELKAMLDSNGANELYPWEYKSVISRLSRLMEKVELNLPGKSDAENEDLSKNMQALYDKTLHSSSLNNQNP
jgi:hypothetical protein